MVCVWKQKGQICGKSIYIFKCYDICTKQICQSLCKRKVKMAQKVYLSQILSQATSSERTHTHTHGHTIIGAKMKIDESEHKWKWTTTKKVKMLA